MDNECKLCTCPNCMAGYEAKAYEHAEQIKLAAQAYVEIQKSMNELLQWSTTFGKDEEEPTDAEVVNDFASYETTWRDKWDQLWRR